MLQAFTAGLLLITISELGDKTFFIAVVMSMRYPRRLVLLGVVLALASMTILSVLLGKAVSFLPQQYIHYAEILFFLGFGVKLLFDAWKMPANAEGEIVDEAKSAVEQSEKNLQNNNKDLAIILETFILTFLAEWGDRTQIATIALAASNNPFGVTIGAIVGHTICALIAVLGGKLIAGRISEKTITFIGGGLFILFGVVAMFNPK
ncbi:MAG: TMEM165/GDT1 family protein [Microcoleaceae cyanobacterium]|jgi:putative Ca2+/H+ antiporter (TMEM165/GDT1 family)